MRWKLAAVVGTAAVGLVVAAPFAMADDVEGGHCEYGDFSVNVEPSCDTNEGGSGRLTDLERAGDLFEENGQPLDRVLSGTEEEE